MVNVRVLIADPLPSRIAECENPTAYWGQVTWCWCWWWSPDFTGVSHARHALRFVLGANLSDPDRFSPKKSSLKQSSEPNFSITTFWAGDTCSLSSNTSVEGLRDSWVQAEGLSIVLSPSVSHFWHIVFWQRLVLLLMWAQKIWVLKDKKVQFLH